jgi:GT2 family glycosyltransferase
MFLSILIVNWNTRADLLQCLASVLANPPGVRFEIVVVDNASSDGSLDAARAAYAQAPEVRLVASERNLGFARANNLAASHARGCIWLLLNPDTLVAPGALAALVGYLQAQPQVAAVGPRLVNPDGTLQPSIERLPTLWREWWRLNHLDGLLPLSRYPAKVLASREPQRVEVLNGACLLLRPEALGPAGLFDADYFVYSEEIDLCDRLRIAGWHLHWLPAAEVTHRGGQSTRQAADAMFLELYRNKIKFFRKRRGRAAAVLYKLVLLQTALVRWALGRLVGPLPVRGRDRRLALARQYQLLLATLPGL